MDTRITKQRTSCFLIGFIIGFLLYVPISSATEFYLTVDGSGRREHCDALQIKANKASCTEGNMVISYDLSTVRGVEVADKKKVQFFSEFTPRSIEKINSSNQRAQDYEEVVGQIEQSKIGYLIRKFKSIESFADLQKLGEKQYQKYGLDGVLHLFLPLVGAFLILVSSFWLIIAAFRVHILWGLGCLLLPFVSLFFLFLHWRSALECIFLMKKGCAAAKNTRDNR